MLGEWRERVWMSVNQQAAVGRRCDESDETAVLVWQTCMQSGSEWRISGSFGG